MTVIKVISALATSSSIIPKPQAKAVIASSSKISYQYRER